VEPQGDGAVWIGDRWYRGRVRLLRQGAGVTAVNQVNIESYLYSVVGSEAIPSWPLEALKAQAVAARTYAIYQSSKDSNRYYDLDTTTATQVYKGLNAEYVSTVEAVEQTQGQVMTYGGKVILAAFHAASGGHTENVEDVWTSPLPYLRGVVDYDQNAPVFQWDKSFTSADLGRIFGVGTVQALTPLRTTARGRVVSLQVQGSRGRKTFTGAKVRQLLELRSALFTVSAEGGRFQIFGRGSGHGIGLSQWGAYSLAQQGIPYAQILSHYYQNAALTQLER
jgi:stage II sporulation protein D